MKSLSRFLFAAGAWLAVAGPALAHPGHGVDGGSYSLLHYLTSPLHVVPTVLLVCAGVAAWRRLRLCRQRR